MSTGTEPRRAAIRSRFAVLLIFTGMLAVVAAWSANRTGEEELPARGAAPLFDPAQAHSLLEGPERDRWQQPDRLVAALGLRPGQIAADIGSGSGYLLPYLSRAVGPSGVVYAEEIQEAFLPDLRRRARALGNVRVLLGTAADPKLPPTSVDCFVLLTVYHEVERPVPFLRTLRRAARREAQLAILDFDADRHGYPPAPVGHEVSERAVLAEAAAAGWKPDRRFEFISSQFFLVFRPG